MGRQDPADPTAPSGSPAGPALRLDFGLSFEDLYRRDGLQRVDDAWRAFLAEADAGQRDALRLPAARATDEILRNMRVLLGEQMDHVQWLLTPGGRASAARAGV